MNHPSSAPDEDWESDAVWKLLDQAPPHTAGARFVEETVRAARLSPPTASWWSRFFSPAPLAGLLAGAAALTIGMVALLNSTPESSPRIAMLDSPQAVAIQDIAETEALIAAADRLDDFSDNELVSLIGF